MLLFHFIHVILFIKNCHLPVFIWKKKEYWGLLLLLLSCCDHIVEMHSVISPTQFFSLFYMLVKRSACFHCGQSLNLDIYRILYQYYINLSFGVLFFFFHWVLHVSFINLYKALLICLLNIFSSSSISVVCENWAKKLFIIVYFFFFQ